MPFMSSSQKSHSVTSTYSLEVSHKVPPTLKGRSLKFYSLRETYQEFIDRFWNHCNLYWATVYIWATCKIHSRPPPKKTNTILAWNLGFCCINEIKAQRKLLRCSSLVQSLEYSSSWLELNRQVIVLFPSPIFSGGIGSGPAIDKEDGQESLVYAKSEIQSSIGWQFFDWTQDLEIILRDSFFFFLLLGHLSFSMKGNMHL